MIINYHLNADDLLQYLAYTNERDPSLRRVMRRDRFVNGIAIMLLIPLVTGGYTDAFSLILAVLAGGGWIMLCPWVMRRASRRYLVKALKEEDEFSGDYSLELTEAGLTARAPGLVSHTDWWRVKKVVVNRTRIYIFVTSLEAVIVPLEAFNDICEYNKFLAKLGAGTGLPLDILKVNSPDVAQET